MGVVYIYIYIFVGVKKNTIYYVSLQKDYDD
jgi:hypothetical protein